MPSPIIYLAFSNNATNPLPDLQDEADGIDSHLHSNDHVNKNVNIRADEITTAGNMTDTLTNFRNRIVLFHYGGHADKRQLGLIDRAIGGGGIAELLGRQNNLACAFLNGCETAQLLVDLQDAGVPVVIATSRKVGDEQAKTLGIEFYKALAQGQTIEEAFKQAASVSRAMAGDEARGLDLRRKDEVDPGADDFPWGLYCKDPKHLKWRLEDAVMDIDLGPAGTLTGAIAFIAAVMLAVLWLVVHVGYENTEVLLGVGSVVVAGVLAWGINTFGKIVPGLLRLKQRFQRLLLKKPVVIALCALVLLLWLFVSSVTIRHPGEGPHEVSSVTNTQKKPRQHLAVLNSTDLTRLLVPVVPLRSKRVVEVEGYVPDTLSVPAFTGKRIQLADLKPRPTLIVRIPPSEFQVRRHGTIELRINNGPPLAVALSKDDSGAVKLGPGKIGQTVTDRWDEMLQGTQTGWSEEDREFFLGVWGRPLELPETHTLTPGDSVQITYLRRNAIRAQESIFIAEGGIIDVLLNMNSD